MVIFRRYTVRVDQRSQLSGELRCVRSVGGECYGSGLAGQESVHIGRGTETNHRLFIAERRLHIVE